MQRRRRPAGTRSVRGRLLAPWQEHVPTARDDVWPPSLRVRLPTVGSSMPPTRSLDASRQELGTLRRGPCRAKHQLVRRASGSTPSLLTLSSPPASPEAPSLRQSPARTPRATIPQTPVRSPATSPMRTPSHPSRPSSDRLEQKGLHSSYIFDGLSDDGAPLGTSRLDEPGGNTAGRRPHSAEPRLWRPQGSTGLLSSLPSPRQASRPPSVLPPSVPPWPFVTGSGGALEAHNSWLSSVGLRASSPSPNGGLVQRRLRRTRSAPAVRYLGGGQELGRGCRPSRSPWREANVLGGKRSLLDPHYVLALERELVRLRSENLRLRKSPHADVLWRCPTRGNRSGAIGRALS